MFMYKPPAEITAVTFYIDETWTIEQKIAAIPENMRGNTVVVDDKGEIYTITREKIEKAQKEGTNEYWSDYGRGGMFKFEPLSEGVSGLPVPGQEGQVTTFGSWKLGADRYGVSEGKVYQAKKIVTAATLGSETMKTEFSQSIEQGRLVPHGTSNFEMKVSWDGKTVESMSGEQGKALAVRYGNYSPKYDKEKLSALGIEEGQSIAILTLSEKSANDYMLCTEIGEPICPLTGSVELSMPDGTKKNINIVELIEANGTSELANLETLKEIVEFANQKALEAYPGISKDSEIAFLVAELACPSLPLIRQKDNTVILGNEKVLAQDEINHGVYSAKDMEGTEKDTPDASKEVTEEAEISEE